MTMTRTRRNSARDGRKARHFIPATPTLAQHKLPQVFGKKNGGAEWVKGTLAYDGSEPLVERTRRPRG